MQLPHLQLIAECGCNRRYNIEDVDYPRASLSFGCAFAKSAQAPRHIDFASLQVNVFRSNRAEFAGPNGSTYYSITAMKFLS